MNREALQKRDFIVYVSFATINKYEVEMELFHIPEFVPFIGDKDVVVKGELGLGTFGYDFKLGKETGLYVGDGYGLGGTIKFED